MLQNSDMVLSDIEKEHLDLAFQSSGIDQCKSGNLFGPRVRRYHLIHFVLSGKGTLHIDSRKFPVRAGQAFYIPAGIRASYQADSKAPWKYCWIGFQGTQAVPYCHMLFPDTYIMDIKDPSVYEKLIMLLLSCTDYRIPPDSVYTPEEFPVWYFSEAKTLSQHLLVNGKTKELFAALLKEKLSGSETVSPKGYAARIKAYLDSYYNEPVKISEIASFLGLNPRYMTAVFRRNYDITPKNYLTWLRIEKAKAFLIDTDYPLQMIANAVGLENPFSFSRLFKNVTGLSPSEYRRQFPNGFPR